jgi:hypothetical protein
MEGTFGVCSGGKTDMKRTASTLTLLALLITLAAGVQTVKAPYTADGQAFILASPLSIVSPSNVTYSSNVPDLNVTFLLLLSVACVNVSYSIDGKGNTTIALVETRFITTTRTYENGTTAIVNATFAPSRVTGLATLPELPEGPHNITVYAKYNANNIIGLDNSTVYFTIDTNSEQKIPEFPSCIILPLLIVASLIVVTYKQRLPKNRQPQQSY